MKRCPRQTPQCMPRSASHTSVSAQGTTAGLKGEVSVHITGTWCVARWRCPVVGRAVSLQPFAPQRKLHTPLLLTRPCLEPQTCAEARVNMAPSKRLARHEGKQRTSGAGAPCQTWLLVSACQTRDGQSGSRARPCSKIDAGLQRKRALATLGVDVSGF